MSKRELEELRDLIEQLFAESGRIFLSQLSGLEFKSEIHFYVHPDDLKHIYKGHMGVNEKDISNLIPLSIEDIRRIVDVLYHPDAIAYLGEDSKGKKFVFFLEGEIGCFNLIDVYAQKRGKLTVKTYYHTKKGVTQSAMTLLAQTSETYGATLSIANIPIILEHK